jgi:hypothetical protein
MDKKVTSIVIMPPAVMFEPVMVITGDVAPYGDMIFAPFVIVRPPDTGAARTAIARIHNSARGINNRFFMIYT